MIPHSIVTAWQSEAPWQEREKVEQDLVLSRALVEIFSSAAEHGLVLRGGTALHKLYLRPAARYSEDIDLVQRESAPIGPALSAIRSVLDPWLGKPKRKSGPFLMTMVYRFNAEAAPGVDPVPLRLKIEINTREHFSVHELVEHNFEVKSPWFSGSAEIGTYRLEELLGTKLRALYQRRKGRDLFDILGAATQASPDLDDVVACFQAYLKHQGLAVSATEFERNLAAKLSDQTFVSDIEPLLEDGVEWDLAEAVALFRDEILPRLRT